MATNRLTTKTTVVIIGLFISLFGYYYRINYYYGEQKFIYMPRLSKNEEIKQWMKGKEIYLFNVVYPYTSFQVGVYADSEAEAIDKLSKQYAIEPDIKPVFSSNRIIY